MTSTFIQPLDLRTVFMNYFLGSEEFFAFAFIIALSFICGRFNMSNRVFLTLITLSSLIMGQYMGQAIYSLLLVILGFVIFKGIARFGN